MGKTRIDGVAGVKALAGKELGTSEWREMTYEAIQKFADATGDHQWIHVDAKRAAAETPFKSTIAHGFLTLSLISTLIRSAVQFEHLRMAINYGLNKVRFPAPLKEGQRYRLQMKLGEVSEIPNGVEGLLDATIEVEGERKPACVAQLVFRFYGAG